MSEINNFLNMNANGEERRQVINKQQTRLALSVKTWLDSVVQRLKGEAVVSKRKEKGNQATPK